MTPLLFEVIELEILPSAAHGKTNEASTGFLMSFGEKEMGLMRLVSNPNPKKICMLTYISFILK